VTAPYQQLAERIQGEVLELDRVVQRSLTGWFKARQMPQEEPILKRILHVVGARPNFMKIAPIMREMAKYPAEFEQILVHMGYLDFVALQAHASLVLTDSGGVPA